MANNFENKTFLFTGKLKNMKREDAEVKVEALGGKAASSVTKTLSVLVSTSETSAKWTKAQELNSKGANIQLWTEEQFLAELEKAGANGNDTKEETKPNTAASTDAKKESEPKGDNATVAKVLIDAGADVNVKTDKGKTPLHNCGSAEIAKLLINAGLDINAKDINGYTPLHNCCSADVAKELIKAGADVNAKNNKGQTPLNTVFDSKVKTVLKKNGAQ